MKEAERRRAILRRLVGMESASGRDRFIGTGFDALDEALGGGLPRGRIVEFFGPAGAARPRSRCNASRTSSAAI